MHTIKISDESYEAFREQFAPKENKGWQPKDKEEYWYVGDDGWVESDYWYGNGNTDDPFRLGQNNVHKSKKLAEQHLELLKAQAEIRNSSDFEPDWSNKEQYKYHIYYDHLQNELMWECHQWCQSPSLAYYPTWEAAKQAIKDFKEQYLLVFGVKK